jgi:hypothetical protein
MNGPASSDWQQRNGGNAAVGGRDGGGILAETSGSRRDWDCPNPVLCVSALYMGGALRKNKLFITIYYGVCPYPYYLAKLRPKTLLLGKIGQKRDLFLLRTLRKLTDFSEYYAY